MTKIEYHILEEFLTRLGSSEGVDSSTANALHTILSKDNLPKPVKIL
jgi:hypothetical protein